MSKINIPTVSGGFNLSQINSNFDQIEQHLNDRVLYRDVPTGEPNQMVNDLDMNSYRIYNLPEPIQDHEPLRKVDADKILDIPKVFHFQPPVIYAEGLDITNGTFTVDYQGVIYYPRPSYIPFTTGVWNPAQWSPLQNTNPGNELLVFDDYTSASDAAVMLPDGQVVMSEYDEVRGVVSLGTITQEQSVYKVADYAKIRSYTGRGTRLRVVDSTGAHWWVRRGAASDNDGTVLVDALGRSWEREYSGAANVRWFGAVGDGVAIDGPKVQAAIDSCKHVEGIFGDVYLLKTDLLVPSNRVLDFKWATLKRDFPNGYCLKGVNSASDGAQYDTNIEVKNVKFRDMGKTDGSDFGAAIRFAWAKDIVIEGVDAVFTSTQPSLLYGAWCMYLSGENVRVNNIYINNAAQGAQGDGIHCGYLKNATISDFNITSGDDAIALVIPPEQWSYEGPNAPSDSIVIGNGYVSSPLYAGLRVGAFDNTSAKAPTNSVYKNVIFHDIVIGQCGSAPILLEDTRISPNIINQHDNIVFSNVRIADQTNSGSLVSIKGVNDISASGALRTKNFKRVSFESVHGASTEASLNMMRIYGVETLTFKSCNFASYYSSANPADSISVRHVDSLAFEECRVRTHSAGNAMALSYIGRFSSLSTNFVDQGNGYRGINVSFISAFPIAIYMRGGDVSGYQRGISSDNSAGATAPITDLVLDGVNIRATISDITGFTETPAGFNIRSLLKRSVWSSGLTGGSGSGGAGNQYVAISVGGVTYKVLHDGTI